MSGWAMHASEAPSQGGRGGAQGEQAGDGKREEPGGWAWEEGT